MNKKNLIYILIIVLIVVGIGYVVYGYMQKENNPVPNPIATVEMQDGSIMKIELYPDVAPNTVANFIRLANRGFYDGLIFHRTIPGFMIQGGDIKGNGTGNPKLSNISDGVENDKEYNIRGEFLANRYKKNTLKHEEGVISMARSDYSDISPSLTEYSYNSAGSQFFIMAAANASMDSYYTSFGKVVEGLDVVHKIENAEVVTRDKEAKEGLDKPVEDQMIKSIKVDTFGIDYGMPKTVEPFDYMQWLQKYYNVDLNSMVGAE